MQAKKGIILEKAPYLSRALENEKGKSYYNDQFEYLDDMVAKTNMVDGKLLDGLHMTNHNTNPDWTVLCNIIMSKYQVSRERAEDILHELGYQESGIKRKLMQSLIHSKNQRELEQVAFSFEMPISLAVLTHITRHRMHSLLFPDFVPLLNMENYMSWSK